MIFEDFSSAHSTIIWSVFGIAFIMGAVANKTNFCTMGAVSDMVNMGDMGRMRAWLFAIAVAVIGVVIIEATGTATVDSSLPPYRNSNFAWLEYILGGTLFGIGMTLGSGCGNKTLVRLGGGNIKSIFLFATISVCAYFMINPFPGSDATLYSTLFYPWTNPTTVSLSTGQDLGSVIAGAEGNAQTIRTVLGVVLAIAILWFVFKSAEFRSSFDNKLGGLIIGLAVIAAWWVTTSMTTIDADGESMSWAQYASAENWDMLEDEAEARPRDVGPQSYTFINPIGQSLRYAINGFDNAYFTFGIAAVLGVIFGSLVWSLISKAFRIEWFANLKDFVMHLIAGVLMGVGGVLALGCTIGQAITGVSTLAMGSFLAFAGIVFGSAMTMRIQYYKMLFEKEATFPKAFVSALVDFKLLPAKFRKLESY